MDDKRLNKRANTVTERFSAHPAASIPTSSRGARRSLPPIFFWVMKTLIGARSRRSITPRRGTAYVGMRWCSACKTPRSSISIQSDGAVSAIFTRRTSMSFS
ncbi:MAG: hypothetical protein JNM42_08870 [Propionivibrio sp.]|nr:hypothetical protein [Propionivibrio sp.]